MTTYYLQSNGDRSAIHTELISDEQLVDGEWRDFEFRSSVEADSWLAAKKALGFELTPLQQHMLNPPKKKAA